MQPFPMLQAFQMGLTSIAPPQMYELCRLARLDGVDDLMSLSCHRAKHRSNRWIPVVMPCQNGLMFILPGKKGKYMFAIILTHKSRNVPRFENIY